MNFWLGLIFALHVLAIIVLLVSNAMQRERLRRIDAHLESILRDYGDGV